MPCHDCKPTAASESRLENLNRSVPKFLHCFPFVPLPARASNKTIPAATETFRLLTAPYIEIDTSGRSARGRGAEARCPRRPSTSAVGTV